MHNMKKVFLFLALVATISFAQELIYYVEGYNDLDTFVFGELEGNLEDAQVEGFLTDEEGNEFFFIGDWIGNGEFEGYDDDGNFYTLRLE